MNMNLKIENNKFKGTKNAVLSLSLILLLAMTIVMAFPQSGLAQVGVPQPEKTVGYISVAPTLVGVGQNATVNLWLWPLPDTYAYKPYYEGFSGITVTFIKPDGTKDTFEPTDATNAYPQGHTEATGSLFFYYAPDTAGNWSVSFTMPEQNITDSSGTVQYLGCTSNTAYFTVQTDPVLAGLLNGYPWAELPSSNAYWSYPINSNNREWSQISGDWLQGAYGYFAFANSFSGVTSRLWQPYGSGPNSAHIVWSQQLQAGGIVGGDYGSLSYGASPTGTVVMEGKVFTNIPNANQFECIDEKTGQVLYKAPGSINLGIHLPGNPFVQAGLDPSVILASSYGATPTSYLLGTSGTTWNYYDPLTGTLMRSISNAPAGYYSSPVRVVDGTNLAYGPASGNLSAWDISKVVNNNWPTGITWTQPLPASLTGSSPSLFGITADVSTIVLTGGNQFWGYSAKDGTSLWNLTLTYPVAANEAVDLYGVNDFIVFDPTATTFHCYSMLTGALLWTSPSFADSPWATTWTVYQSETNDYNNFYTMFPDGTMAALSLATGQIVWRSTAFPSTEYTANAVPYVIGMVMVGGNIYAYAGYSVSYQIDPIPRQAMLVCVNATTGNITYTLNGGVFPVAAANGYVIGSGLYDGNFYCVGKGQTSTSVTIQNDVVANHATVLIKGNVLDQSPAQAGTPAVADASMSEWMDYLHMQNSTLLNNPPTPEGVLVTLTAIDPNGNPITIGTTTTDSEGNYAINFEPETTGIYTIKASFDGTNSYWPSDSETKLSVIAAPETSATSPPLANPPYELYTVGMGVAIIAALAVAVLLLRKKP